MNIQNIFDLEPVSEVEETAENKRLLNVIKDLHRAINICKVFH